MSLYFFDCDDNGRVFSDDVGSELNDDEKAEREAKQILFEIVRTTSAAEKRSIKVRVRDAAGRILYRAGLVFRGLRTS
jgi:hypothetical protein